MKEINFGVIGGKVFCGDIHEKRGAKLVAVCDVDPKVYKKVERLLGKVRGEAVMNQTSHYFDLLTWYSGKPGEVYAKLINPFHKVELKFDVSVPKWIAEYEKPMTDPPYALEERVTDDVRRVSKRKVLKLEGKRYCVEKWKRIEAK